MPHKTRSWGKFFVLGLAAIAVLSLAARAGVRDDIRRSFQVESGGTLTIDTQRGSIEVTAARGDSVEIEIQREARTSNSKTARDLFERFPIEFDQKGGDIFVTAEFTGGRLSRIWNDLRNKLQVKFIVTVPLEYNIDCLTRGGSIGVTGLHGRIKSKTSGGSLRFDGVIGPIEGETSGGGIRIGEVEGRVNVHTSGGSIQIDRARGEVTAHTSGGGISVNEVRGVISARTSGGSIKAHISQQPERNCRLQTSGGSVTVFLSDSIGMDVDAHTSGGSVSTEFPVTLKGTIKRNTLQAQLNGGGPELYLRTSGGSIRIRKK